MWYERLKSKELWKIFNEISSIPRESGNEERIGSFLLEWAKNEGLRAIRDKAGNVIIKAPATTGRESEEPIALQAHMDMVCVKREGSSHDFEKDPIEIVLENGLIRAKDTSLGGDNGIGIAIALDILSDKSLSHGPLEAIFTVSEETGLIGAFSLEEKDVDSRKLINLDSEEEGIFYIGCAGGVDITADYDAIRIKGAEGKKGLKIEVSGLLGGHSGGEIHKGRANAIKLLARTLFQIGKEDEVAISSIRGGTRRNVIPSSAEAIITVNDIAKALDIVKKTEKEARYEYQESDGNIRIECKEASLEEGAFSAHDSPLIIDLLNSSPHGVKSMSLKTPGIVETSSNLALVSTEKNRVSVEWSVRSLIESARDSLADEISSLCSLGGFNSKKGSPYPGWAPNPDSSLTKEMAEAYRKHTGKDPIITSIHAGLECGIINDRIKNMDSVSIGPNLFDVHSVNENLDIESSERLSSFLKAFISERK